MLSISNADDVITHQYQSGQPFPHPLAASTQYPTAMYYKWYSDDYQLYDDDTTQL